MPYFLKYYGIYQKITKTITTKYLSISVLVPIMFGRDRPLVNISKAVNNVRESTNIASIVPTSSIEVDIKCTCKVFLAIKRPWLRLRIVVRIRHVAFVDSISNLCGCIVLRGQYQIWNDLDILGRPMHVHHAQIHPISPCNGLRLLLRIGENPRRSSMLTNL